MATVKPDRFSIDNQLLARLSDLKSAKLAHREACLLLARQPDDEERKHTVAALEAEIKEHELAIERLEAAKLAQAEAESEQAKADRINTARAAAEAVATASARIHATLDRLVDAFETTIGPALAELEALHRERASQAWAAVSGALDPEAASRSAGTLSRLSGQDHAAAALIALLVRSGIGHVGPSLAPYVSVSAPVGGVGAPAEVLERFDAQAKNLDAFLAEAIERAARPQPATTEE